MAALETLAREKHAHELKRDAAIAALVNGNDPPTIRDVPLARMPSELREWATGVMATDTFLLERVAELAAEVARLRAEVAALRGMKGAKS